MPIHKNWTDESVPNLQWKHGTSDNQVDISSASGLNVFTLESLYEMFESCVYAKVIVK